MTYLDDDRDIRFNLLEWLDLDAILKEGPYQEVDREQLAMVLDEALKVAKGSLSACNGIGDRVGAQLENGQVRLPEGFPEAFRDLASGGWISATMNPEFGGMGLPECVGTGISEFLMGANTALGLTVLLTRGSAHLIEAFGSEALKAIYCERMYAGEWTGTMCLTEAGAGSDLGALNTKALRQADGSYLISGEKIFITSGDHGLTPNIVHAVLARTPDAPAGPKGLSLFVVPKIRVNPDGSLGASNDVTCAGIEHKLGIHGSPTCSLVFGANDACQGFLLGQEGQGLAHMFQMMNAARYEVGVQGLGNASAAHQAALAYAKERLQGRGPHSPRSATQSLIIEHPDVRRMLLMQSAYVQAMRALVSYTAWCMDMAHVSEGEERDRWQGLVELLTPISKAWCSDWGFRVTEWALQTYGGYGYTMDYPAEQYLRDCKIASIYEGTNGIQALDLVGRKFRMQDGRPVKHLMKLAQEAAEALAGDPVLGASAGQLQEAVKALGAVLAQVPTRENAALLTLLNAVPMLDMLGHVVGGYLLLQQAELAGRKLAALLAERGVDPADPEALRALWKSSRDAAFYQTKIQAAIHFAHRGLPLVGAHATSILAGETAPMEAVL
ncbi:acyl-CoA dehydrogenase [Geothrix sp. PMB-07]|uniref:acyl-CoA dehydrogenase n=1 Tax=Geothrix sp. PMB-07 TaxID=3068640 RepID=UPI002741E491|nr:acyl-CoA dehydrogenase [Geothrix sp. PMB-07]WLT33011.1 acyl-CoA dehydrogenase [Geothrix sp. PMB-07]